MSDLLSLEEAQRRLLALVTPGPTERVSFDQALGRYLAEDLFARRTQPYHPLSAMDGWAVRQADGSGPWQIVGESAAGHPFAGHAGARQAVRISTGAVVPAECDMVVVQEQCKVSGSMLCFSGDLPNPLGRHIRPRGMDFLVEDLLLRRGCEIRPGSLALAISAGHATIPVHRRPRVAIIDSGDELARPGDDVAPGHIPASNGPMLAAMLAAIPCHVTGAGPVPDDVEAIAAALAAQGDADLVITTGGASVGDHDLIRPALAQIGAEIDFWRVALKPGKPLMIATRGKQVILGLPGNPASAFVTATLFALPIVRVMLGSADPFPRREVAILADALPTTGKRAEFVRARFAADGVTPLHLQDSGALAPLSAAEALICRAPYSNTAEAGERVEIIRI
ncbi:MAG TPA: molybdopterin molybdotransferase MoeA [Croceicoccus sp.]|nr:molybdopterin molybdotransferase MoeA [Croceicoccus sp.]